MLRRHTGLAAVVVLALIAAVGGGVLASLSNAQGLWGKPAAAVQARMDALQQTLHGNPLQQRAGTYLQFHAQDVKIAACMRRSGERYRDAYVGDPRHDVPVESRGGYSSTWTAPLGGGLAVRRHAGSGTDERVTVLLNKYAHPRPGVSERYRRTVLRCAPDGQSNVDDVGPREATRLSADLTRLYSAVDASLGGGEPYDSCMASKGYDPPRFGGEPGWSGLYIGVVSRTPGRLNSPAWPAYLRFAPRAFAADTACRKHGHARALAMLRPRLAAFEKRHAADLASAEQGWDRIVDRAVREGFRP